MVYRVRMVGRASWCVGEVVCSGGPLEWPVCGLIDRAQQHRALCILDRLDTAVQQSSWHQI